MGLREQLSTDITYAMRTKDAEKLSPLRMLRAAIQNFEVARTDAKHPQHGQPIAEEDLLGVVQKEIKQRQDSIEQFRKGNREDLAAKEEAEIKVLEGYLPDQMSRDEIAQHVTAIIGETGKEFKAVMPRAARELKGRADGRLVNEVVRELTA
jgi:uncharacterized protein YqeY